MLAQWADRFIHYLRLEKGISPATESAYRSDLKQALPLIGIPQTADDLSAYLNWLNAQSFDALTVLRKCATLKSFLKFLKQESVIPVSLHRDIRGPKRPKKLPKSLSESDLNHLLAVAAKSHRMPYRNVAIIELFYATGCRISEMISLTTTMETWKHQGISVVGKRNKERQIPVYTQAIQAVDRYIEFERNHLPATATALWLNERGRPLTRNSLYLLVKSLMKQAGLRSDAGPHSIRHAFATHLLDHDLDIRQVQELLGHASVTTTEIYTQVSQAKLKSMLQQAHPRG